MDEERDTMDKQDTVKDEQDENKMDTNEAEQNARPEPENDAVEGTSQDNWEQIAEERYEQLVRLRADFENFRRRVDRDREESIGRLTGGLLADFLPVYDNLERAIKYMPNEGDAKAWRVGVEMTLKGFDEVLARKGVTPIPTVGQMFDPRLHDAVDRVDSEAPEGTIVDEVQKGFQWKDQVLRASVVRVSTGNSPDAEE